MHLKSPNKIKLTGQILFLVVLSASPTPSRKVSEGELSVLSSWVGKWTISSLPNYNKRCVIDLLQSIGSSLKSGRMCSNNLS